MCLGNPLGVNYIMCPSLAWSMDRRKFLHGASVLTGPLIAGCIGGPGGGVEEDTATATPTPTKTPAPTESPTPTQTPESTPTASGKKTIAMQNIEFQTLYAEVDVGTTIEWVNQDSFAHTVTSAQFHDKAKSWSLDERVSGGGSISHTFDAEGVYEYFCTIHGKDSMCGAVLVGDVTLNKDLPCEGGGYDY